MRVFADRYPQVRMWVFPELHLDSAEPWRNPDEFATPLDDERLAALGDLARELGVWLVPGSVYERGDDGSIYNTSLVYSPEGERVSTYRKIFPWRPAEVSTPGSSFEVFDMPGYGRVGMSICYDVWYPEHTRHLAWMGAELVLNLVQTGTSDREQELTIVRGNAIMNQVWIASINSAAPTGRGRSLLVDPQGVVRAACPESGPEVLTVLVNFEDATAARQYGTGAISRPWSQFRQEDAPIPLPLYGGRIDPAVWNSEAPAAIPSPAEEPPLPQAPLATVTSAIPVVDAAAEAPSGGALALTPHLDTSAIPVIPRN
ncbi:carbon-nitrogen hydrolase family protein [Leucobacter sp. CSA1]|uniref:Carbon-nitrogen hydrolase family protein n=1 Tax=Leucobacter chromiisoli TaxID=2796471 RepID=A0A934UW62_9MICO|nr:carbon-nitrogen hydrolase family protein [Leucobacter chromiisoli]MBK0419597.1 carbon-nitrogen hydrolase family protein [Leucobacter chromiisoli]